MEVADAANEVGSDCASEGLVGGAEGRDLREEGVEVSVEGGGGCVECSSKCSVWARKA